MKKTFILFSLFSSTVLASPIKLIYTNNLEGYVDTCGCATTPGGGVKRRLNWFKKLNPAPDSTIYIDAGDSLNSGTTFLDYEKAKKEKAADIILKHFKMLNIDALTLGERDFSFDIKKIETLMSKYKTPLIISNSDVKSYKKSIIFTRSKQKIGILGIISPKLVAAKALKLTPVIAALKKQVPELKKTANIIILIAHCDEDELEKILKEVKGLDIIVSSHIPEQLTQPRKVNNTLVLRMLSGGDSIGMLDYSKTAKDAIEYKNTVVFLGDEFNQDNELKQDLQEYQKLQSEDPAADGIDDNF